MVHLPLTTRSSSGAFRRSLRENGRNGETEGDRRKSKCEAKETKTKIKIKIKIKTKIKIKIKIQC